jgi:peptidoglycan/xylan/chitin deacetylase (PgdA/CDA1 family)
MRCARSGFRSALAVISVAAGLALAFPAAGAPPAGAVAAAGPPIPLDEGPAGPPARMPGGGVAAPPQVSSSQVSAGCPAAPYGPRYYAPGRAKTVALTFDDGPGASTAEILAVLRTQGVTATFFNAGQNAAARPQLVRDEARNGYLAGNHTWSHPDLTTLTAAAQAAQLDEATAEQKAQIGAPPCAFRPPGGNYNRATLSLAQQRRMKVWLWSADTEDWKANGSASSYWVHRIIRLAESEGGTQQHPVVLMHNQPAGNPATVAALPPIIGFFRSRGYTFVNLLGDTGLGYLILTANGGVHSFGTGWHGSDLGPGGAKGAAVAMAADPATGGYWILRSAGGVDGFSAPWLGSARGRLPAGAAATAMAGSRGGYLLLASDGGVYAFGTPRHGSDAGRLKAGVTAVGLAADPATGGYWILRSDGGVDGFGAPWHGSLRGKLPAGTTVTAIASSPASGYLVLTSDGGVHAFGTRWLGSDAGRLKAGVTAVGLVSAPATSGYWILKSDGGVDGFGAPWHGSLRGRLPAGQTVTAIAGQ